MKKNDFADRLGDYKEVPERIVEFYERYPDGALRLIREPELWSISVPTFNENGDVSGQTLKHFIRCTAGAFAHKDDAQPKGVGVADEPFPGKTTYTRDSEVMNAETSAWGRAIVACGILAKGEKIASADEVRNRQNGEGLEKGLVAATKTPAPNPPPPADSSAISLTEMEQLFTLTDGLRDREVVEKLVREFGYAKVFSRAKSEREIADKRVAQQVTAALDVPPAGSDA